MRIATWNLQRLDKRKDQDILEKLVKLDADILVLTETNSRIQLKGYNCISTTSLPAHFNGCFYKDGENRTSILTKYNVKTKHQTYDSFTSVCVDIDTPLGLLTVYGTIIGVFGNRQPRFDNDLNGQIGDFKKLITNQHACIAGDFNITFAGQAWPSAKARQTLSESFLKHKMINTTAAILGTVDHIVISDSFLEDMDCRFETWNQDKGLSDHVGHLLILKRMNEVKITII